MQNEYIVTNIKKYKDEKNVNTKKIKNEMCKAVYNTIAFITSGTLCLVIETVEKKLINHTLTNLYLFNKELTSTDLAIMLALMLSTTAYFGKNAIKNTKNVVNELSHKEKVKKR